MWPDKPRALISYAYITGGLEAVPAGVDLMIDSGAFTAFSTGRTVNLTDYTAFLTDNADRITAAFALDVIGDHRASRTNYDRMRAALPATVTLIPTWHVGSPWDALTDLLHDAGYVGIGGMVPYFRQHSALIRICVRAHKMARTAGVRLHGLGATGSTIRQLPWYSVDSSSWTMPRRRPMVYVADRQGTMRSITRGKADEAKRHAPTLRRYGLNPIEFAVYGSSSTAHVGLDVGRDRVTDAVTASIRSYMHAEAVHPHGTRIYLAGTPSDMADPIVTAWERGSPWT